MEEIMLNKYKYWASSPMLTDIEKMELATYKEKEIIEHFNCDLEFGTAGIRGVMGLGTAKMNKYVIRQATQGLANYLNNEFKAPTVAIAYDSRNNSDVFAKEAASVLAANNIKVYIFKELMPVPILSYTVRRLKCSAGIVITASHNPKQYNGYKVYGSDGCQMTEDGANKVLANIRKLDIFTDVKISKFIDGLSNGAISYIPESVIQNYYESVLSQSIKSEKVSPRNLKITYTPLHGSGLKPVMAVLEKDGFMNIDIVEEQKNPDGNFNTCPYPNPEIKEAMELGIKLMLEKENDILIATDPDSDRAGVVVNHHNNPIILSGNEIGILLFDFICKARYEEHHMPEGPVVVKTIVSSDLINLMAKKYFVKVIDVLTGFKYIGEQIKLLEKTNKTDKFILGFEESCGYLTNPQVRDKDAVNAMMLICEMANYYKSQGIDLVDRLNQLYDEFGDYKTVTLSYEFASLEGKQHIQDLMVKFRNPSIQNELGKVEYIGDYKLQKIIRNGKSEPTNLPSSDVIKIFLSDAETITIRPSGTEPKIKAYIFAHGEARVNALKQKIDELMN